MFLQIMLLSIVASPGAPTWAPDEFKNEAAYVLEHVGPFSATFVRRSDQVAFFFSGSRAELGVQADRPISTASSGPFPREAPSGLPLARQVLVLNRPSALNFYTQAAWETMALHITSPRESNDRFAKPRQDDFGPLLRSAEANVRKALAGFAARRLVPRSAVTLNGRSLPAWTASGSDLDFVHLRAAAVATGLSLRFNQADGRAALGSGESERLFLLAADKVKVDGNWTEMGDLVMLRDNEWFVPLASLPR